jgi:hypothetical protein
LVLVLCHTPTSLYGIGSQNAVWVAMIVFTWFRDLDHERAAPLGCERLHVITRHMSAAILHLG